MFLGAWRFAVFGVVRVLGLRGKALVFLGV